MRALNSGDAAFWEVSTRDGGLNQVTYHRCENCSVFHAIREIDCLYHDD